MTLPDVDVAVVGAGAAGLATGIFVAHASPAARVAVFDGARKPGAKILVSGGGRCNVTNVTVTDADFNGGRAGTIRRILRALPVPATIAFFRHIGVPLHEEAGGKLFPDSNRARDVLDALLRETRRSGVALREGHRVHDVTPSAGGFLVTTSEGAASARLVVLATGGLSLPKTGSDGGGYAIAQRLGHTLVPTTPALVPLVLDAQDTVHTRLSGVSLPARIDVRVNDAIATRVAGPLLWTHFGISGPAALDSSRHWLRARLEGRQVRLSASFCPTHDFESLESLLVDAARRQPRATVHAAVAGLVPASMATALLEHLEVENDLTFAELTRADRRRLIHALTEWPLPVVDSRGYNYAEVTAGGIPLTEIDAGTMESRVCRGLYLAGEILDVDGRIGGFNFQWAWSSARVVADAIARALQASEGSHAE